MKWLADLPVQRKLRLAIVTTTAVALVLACTFFLILEFVGYRRNVRQTINALARVTANNSTAAIAFADEADARETLEALRAEPQILVAALYDGDGQLFASFSAAPGEIAPPTAPTEVGLYFQGGYVVRVERVVQEDRVLGTLYLRATLADLYYRTRIYAVIVGGVLAASFALAWILGSILQRTISRPILELAQTADAISKGSDYSLRARQYGRDELGRLTAAFNTMLERTQAAVGALRESEARFRHMADGAPVLIWLADAFREATWFNQRWLDFVGRPLARELRRGWLDNVHPDDRDHWERVYGAAFEARQAFQLEYRLRRHDGEYRWMLDHGIPRFSAEGEFSGYIGSCIDVTDRRQAEQEIAEARDRALAASRAKDEFLARLSHELRTPLNPVLLVASDAAQNLALPEDVRADFDMIAKNVALEARLIDDLLDLTRIVRGKLALDLRVRDAHAILRDAISTVWSELEAKRIRLTLDLTADRTNVLGDSVRLQQVFWNVLKNAIKFTPEAGSIIIESRTLAESDRVMVKITDTGIGMTPTELNRVFEAFAQGEHTEGVSVRHFGGLGLGLAISRMLVELHSGAIRASSRGRNLGSTFVIELPIARAEAGIGQTELQATKTGAGTGPERNRVSAGQRLAPGSRGRVLLVEDHVPTCRILAHLLSRRGFDVVSVATAAAARSAAAEGPYTFLISDIGLPDGDGVALLKDLRAAQPGLRGVALSGYGAEQDIARSRGAGFDDHLTKPINVDALDQAIARFTSQPDVGNDS
jgi:PAS domain S-box-containing protein